jgi:hypothetical protein
VSDIELLRRAVTYLSTCGYGVMRNGRRSACSLMLTRRSRASYARGLASNPDKLVARLDFMEAGLLDRSMLSQ